MKAIHLTAYGNPAQSLMMVEVSEPNAPSASEALVRMEYAPINDSDLLLAKGVYFLNPKLPSVIGGEGAGIVEAIGPGVTSVKVGDRVTIPFGTFTRSEKVLARRIAGNLRADSDCNRRGCQYLWALTP
jgi:NADPH:quinone reductase-like Zn-dependent oxidoreductase